MIPNTFRTALRAPLPGGLLAAVGLIAALDSALARHPDDFTDVVPANWVYSARAARCEAVGADVLCLGDSLIKQGLAAPVAGAVLRRPVFNLAVCHGSLPASYFLFRRSLEAGARPRAVVLDY